MKSKQTIGLIQGLVFALVCGPLGAASFNCQEAHTLVEFAVCAYPQLSTLDQRITTAYRQTLNAGPAGGNAVRQQQSWLAERDRCTTLNCLLDVYGERSASLLGIHGPNGGNPVAGVYEYAGHEGIGRLDLLQTEAGRVQFRLDTVSKQGSRTRIDGDAELLGDTLSYRTDTADCTLQMRFFPGRVLISPSSSCGRIDGNYQLVIDKAPIFRRF